MGDPFQQLLGTTVVLVAHPDDEVIGFGALLQKMERGIVVFATDGAPRDEYFWKAHGSREEYSRIRRQEAREALAVVGAGVIGAEYACTFAALGVEVHLIDGRDSLLSFLDRPTLRARSRKRLYI